MFESHLAKGQQVIYLMKKEIDPVSFFHNNDVKSEQSKEQQQQQQRKAVGLTEFHSDPSLQLLELSYVPAKVVGVHFEDNLYNPFYTLSVNDNDGRKEVAEGKVVNNQRELQTDIMR
jgi:hypothetical protein